MSDIMPDDDNGSRLPSLVHCATAAIFLTSAIAAAPALIFSVGLEPLARAQNAAAADRFPGTWDIGIFTMSDPIRFCSGRVPQVCNRDNECSDDWASCPGISPQQALCESQILAFTKPMPAYAMQGGCFIALTAVSFIFFGSSAFGNMLVKWIQLAIYWILAVVLSVVGLLGAFEAQANEVGSITVKCASYPAHDTNYFYQRQVGISFGNSTISPGHSDYVLRPLSLADFGVASTIESAAMFGIVIGSILLTVAGLMLLVACCAFAAAFCHSEPDFSPTLDDQRASIPSTPVAQPAEDYQADGTTHLPAPPIQVLEEDPSDVNLPMQPSTTYNV